MSPALIAYRLLTRLLEPLAPRLLDARAKQGKENPARVDERLGLASAARPPGDLREHQGRAARRRLGRARAPPVPGPAHRRTAARHASP